MKIKKLISSPYFSFILALLLSMIIPVLFVDSPAWRSLLLCIPASLHVLHVAQASHNTGKGKIASGIKEKDSEKVLFVCRNIGYEIMGSYLLIPLLVLLFISVFPRSVMDFLYETSLGMLILETIYVALVYLFCFSSFSKKEFTINSKEIKYKRSFGVLERHRTFIINKDCIAFNISGRQSVFLKLTSFPGTKPKSFFLDDIKEQTVINFFLPYLPYQKSPL